MVKYMGLGIACLTLVLSGVTRAVEIKTEKGICGKYDDKCFLDDKGCKDKGNKGVTLDLGVNLKDECKKLEKDGCKDVKELKELKDCKHEKECKEDKKDHCKIEWKNHCEKHDICEDKHDDHCDLIIDHGCRDSCDPNHCNPACVPAPASSAMGGAGLLGIALMVFARSRRSINA
jgi:hypothetical protein